MGEGIDFPAMREFERITATSPEERRRRARVYRRRRLMALSVLLVMVYMAGLGVQAWALPLVGRTLGLAGGSGLALTGKKSEAPYGEVEETREPFNILVMGIDRRPKNNDEGIVGSRSDTLMLVRVIPETGDVRIASIPRDLLVEIKPGKEGKINSAFAYGGPERAVAVVENYARVNIDHYAVVDFGGFRDIVDAVGGLELKVKGRFPPNWKLRDGAVQTLDGKHALFYARYRQTAGGDLDRIKRQQQVIAALRSQALEWQTLTEVPEIVRAIRKNVATDLTLRESVAIGRIMVRRGKDARMTATQLKGSPATLGDGSQVLVPDAAANEEVLRNFR